MDTLTHGVAGALLGKAVCTGPGDRLMRRAVLLGSLLPDLDMIGGWVSGDRIFQLEFHRGITHSIVALPGFALLLGLLTARWSGSRRWRPFCSAYAAGIALHIFLDVITSYGTMIFTPASKTRAALDLVFIIDLTLSSIVLVPQMIAWTWSEPEMARRRAAVTWLTLTSGGMAAWYLVNAVRVPLPIWAVGAASIVLAAALWLPKITRVGYRWPAARYCQIGMAILAIYLGACAAAHRAALSRVVDLAESHHLQALRIASLPAPPSLLNWTGLVQTAEGITRIPIRLTDGREPAIQFFANSQAIPNEQTLQALPGLQTYLRFARFPWITYREQDGQRIVEYQDLQFLRPFNRRDPPFTFRVLFDAQGRLLAAGLAGP